MTNTDASKQRSIMQETQAKTDATNDVFEENGLSLYDAYMVFIAERFSENSQFELDTSRALLVSKDAADALQRTDRKLGSIYRHPALVCAGDCWDLVANRLAATGEISLEEARDDCLVHRLFWDQFYEGKKIAVGRLNTIAAPDMIIEAFLWRSFTHAHLRLSLLESDQGQFRFVAVRVYPSDKLPATVSGPFVQRGAVDRKLDVAMIKTPALREMAHAILELKVPPTTPWSKGLGNQLRATLKNQGASPPGSDALRKRYHTVMPKLSAAQLV